MNLIVLQNGYTQIIDNGQYSTLQIKENQYCMPAWRAAALFEDAIQKRYLDSMVINREDRIVFLEDEKTKMKADYENLLKISNSMLYIEIANRDNAYKEIKSYKEQLRITRKQKRWANIKFYAALAALGTVTYFAITD
jgi:hypothetical protein